MKILWFIPCADLGEGEQDHDRKSWLVKIHIIKLPITDRRGPPLANKIISRTSHTLGNISGSAHVFNQHTHDLPSLKIFLKIIQIVFNLYVLQVWRLNKNNNNNSKNQTKDTNIIFEFIANTRQRLTLNGWRVLGVG